MSYNIQCVQNIILCIVLVSGSILSAGCSRKPQADLPPVHAEVDPNSQQGIVVLDQHKVFHAAIRIEPVVTKTIAVPLELSGKVSLNEKKMAHITARLNGRVEKLQAFTNDEVREGEVVMEIFSQEYIALQSEYLQTLERFLRIQQSNIDAVEIGTAEAIFNASKRKLELLGMTSSQINALGKEGVPLSYLEVKAPFNGTMLETHVRLGETIKTGDDLATISDLTHLWVIADIYEKDLASIRPGMTVTITTPAYPHTVFSGTVSSLNGVLDLHTRTVKARIELTDAGHKLKPEMFCTVRVQTKSGAETIKIPSSALLGETEKHFVFIAVNDTTFQRRDVRTGVETGDYFEIVDGLLIGEHIVVNGGFFLKSELARETFSEEH